LKEETAIGSKKKALSMPQVAIGGVVMKDDKILLVKRHQEPHKGEWAIPGGSVKLGETLQGAVEREVREETGLVVNAKDPMHVFDLIERDEQGHLRFHYVIVDLRAEYVAGTLHPSDDAIDAQWFSPKEIKDIRITETTKEFLEKIQFLR
jgi:ADP-ribose pyrophosphatase